MNIIGARYTEEGQISANIDGVDVITPDDMSNRHRQILENLGIEIEPYLEPTIEEKRKVASLSRAEFAISASYAGIITEQEAEEWAGGTAIPAWVLEAIGLAIESGVIAPEEELPVRISVRTRSRVRRMDRLILVLGELSGLKEEQIDALFGI